ncbi:paraquat-inducible protein A [Neorhizobium galegae]|uniref:paraquat-inducible protein A n=1 Tax=Neorhizobium galegae TaxID=399 RepID=UPI001AE28CD3|nr:paraquat-inducible protein A [Neorhizobium galegae]MBP2548682.1 paraquat-inducible protein A [Neorhizobium galegae]
MRRLRQALLLVSAVFLLFGIYLPILQIDRLFLFSQTPSLIDLVSGLFEQGDFGLALLIALFSIVFPAAKLLLVFCQEAGWRLGQDRMGVFGRALPHLSKWSMMDVMLVAIAIFAAKGSGLATAVAQPGLWFYAGSAIMTGLLSPFSSMAADKRPDTDMR